MGFDFKTTLSTYNRLIRLYEKEIQEEKILVSSGDRPVDPEYLHMLRMKLEKVTRKKDKLLNGQKLEKIS